MDGEQWVQIAQALSIAVYAWPVAEFFRAWQSAGNAEAWKYQAEISGPEITPANLARPLTSNSAVVYAVDVRANTGLSRMQYELPAGVTVADMLAITERLKSGYSFSRRNLCPEAKAVSANKYQALVNWMLGKQFAIATPNGSIHLEAGGRALFQVGK